ncbi:MAG: phage portal protein [Mesorhizobium sp.]|uniref:phage portal protein n=1 Tax=Mesorhizobium sp. TaxID=1871066 RepID=UPI00121682F1|nr:phage portal protein [Mesorhizobium sp.]TIL94794.1 MAG: phage portal protein [Mesorhizobium sp.]
MWPFKSRQPPVETKSLSNPDADLLAVFGITDGAAAVPASVALGVPAVAAAVRAISEAAATLPLTVKRKVGDAEADVPEFPALKLLTGQANPWTSGFEMIRDMMASTLTRNEGGLAFINRVDGRPAELIRYDVGVLTVSYEPSGEPIYRMSDRIVPASDVVHVRGAFSKCPLDLCAEAIGVAHLLEAHAASLFRQKAMPGGVIEFPAGVKIGDTALQKMKTAWTAAYAGSDNTGKTSILWDGGTFKALTFSSVDAQFLELRRFQISEICRAFRCPPQMLYDLERATWSNAEQMQREFITYSLMPWLRALESAFNRALLTDEERGEYRFCFDIDDTSQADLTARATAISTLITAKVLNSNEARNWLGMQPRDGGDAYENPNTGTKPANDNTPITQEDAA